MKKYKNKNELIRFLTTTEQIGLYYLMPSHLYKNDCELQKIISIFYRIASNPFICIEYRKHAFYNYLFAGYLQFIPKYLDSDGDVTMNEYLTMRDNNPNDNYTNEMYNWIQNLYDDLNTEPCYSKINFEKHEH